jgi:hypothetical protein
LRTIRSPLTQPARSSAQNAARKSDDNLFFTAWHFPGQYDFIVSAPYSFEVGCSVFNLPLQMLNIKLITENFLKISSPSFMRQQCLSEEN